MMIHPQPAAVSIYVREILTTDGGEDHGAHGGTWSVPNGRDGVAATFRRFKTRRWGNRAGRRPEAGPDGQAAPKATPLEDGTKIQTSGHRDRNEGSRAQEK